MIVVPFWAVEDPAERVMLRDALLEPWGGSVQTFELAYRLGRIAHVFT